MSCEGENNGCGSLNKIYAYTGIARCMRLLIFMNFSSFHGAIFLFGEWMLERSKSKSMDITGGQISQFSIVTCINTLKENDA